MKSPVAKLAVTAVIVIVCVVGVSLWRTTSSGIALADVLAQVQQSSAYMYQTTMTITGLPDQVTKGTTEGTVLIAPDYGMKMTLDISDPNIGIASRAESYVLFKEKTMIMLMPEYKTCHRMQLDDEQIDLTRQENYDPTSLLKQILDSKYESLGRSIIDGVEVEGFQTTDPNCMGGPEGQVQVKIWVDIKTQLPVREEIDIQAGEMQIHSVEHSFQWNYPATSADFTPVIPADYTTESDPNLPAANQGDHTSRLWLPAFNENGAIAALRACADLTGRYPKKIDLTTVTSLLSKIGEEEAPIPEMPPPPEPPELPVEEDAEAFDVEGLKKIMELPREERAAKMEEHLAKMKEHLQKSQEQSRQWDEQYKKWQEQSDKWQEQVKIRDEQWKKMDEQVKEIDSLMPMQSAATFYMMLTAQKKEPAYYGNVVTPQDADRVLMRWKLSDSEYRVIYGDLHAETVTPEKLAELERALPK